MSLFWYAVSVSVVILLLLFLLYYPSNIQHTVSNRHTPQDIVGDKLRILDADDLIRILNLKPSLTNIQVKLGLSEENWHKDAYPLLYNYIAFVQRIPASESHHHAGDGGLVRHTLDVVALSLTAASAYSWPPGAQTEEIARLNTLWRFGILVAELLHDIDRRPY